MQSIKAIIIDIVGSEAASTILEYITNITQEEDLYDYLKDFIDLNNPSHYQALDDFLQQQFGKQRTNVVKKEEKENYKKKQCTESTSKEIICEEDSSMTRKGGKNKFVPLLTESGETRRVPLLPGRMRCDCLAGKHNLIANCLSCGRIVCAQEGSGPCFFCGELVCTREEREILNRNSKKSEMLRKQLVKKGLEAGDKISMPHPISDSLTHAIDHKNRLLENDRNNVRRSHVIDDEMDYYAASGNVWLSPEERKKLSEKEEKLRSIRHASRRDVKQKYQIDFSGRLIRSAEDSRMDASHQLYTPDHQPDTGTILQSIGQDNLPRPTMNPYLEDEAPQFLASKTKPFKHNSTTVQAQTKSDPSRNMFRLQDQELREIVDEGRCLSMHQPWASLLVAGIKRHEGRSWYTPHRGRLWIASTAKPVNPADVQELESFYRQRGANATLLPRDYPSGCLLGCVDVVDCLPKEIYLQQFPDGESGSQFVFICENPRELPLKLPISGKHKIYKLEKPIHDAAKRAISVTL